MKSPGRLSLDRSKRYRPSRFMHVLMAVTISVAFAGYLIGVGAEHEPPPGWRVEHEPARNGTGHPPKAVSYRELPVRLAPNAKWTPHVNQLPAIERAAIEQLKAAEDQRSAGRAYHGAPPVIPHPVDQRSAASCLACHGNGAKVGQRIATPISHAHYTNCTQCHVESPNPQFNQNAEQPLTGNIFQGLAQPKEPTP